jgi:hypothetical protein
MKKRGKKKGRPKLKKKKGRKTLIIVKKKERVFQP